MIAIHPQFIVDAEDRRQSVILPEREWREIVEELEELDDIRAYDAAMSGDREAIPFEQAVQEIEQDRKG